MAACLAAAPLLAKHLAPELPVSWHLVVSEDGLVALGLTAWVVWLALLALLAVLAAKSLLSLLPKSRPTFLAPLALPASLAPAVLALVLVALVFFLGLVELAELVAELTELALACWA